VLISCASFWLSSINVDLLIDDSQNEAQLMSTGTDDGTFVLLKSHQGNTSQAYSLEKSIPKQ
jgi:hypothetical protein